MARRPAAGVNIGGIDKRRDGRSGGGGGTSTVPGPKGDRGEKGDRGQKGNPGDPGTPYWSTTEPDPAEHPVWGDLSTDTIFYWYAGTGPWVEQGALGYGIGDHVAEADPHAQYLKETDAATTYATQSALAAAIIDSIADADTTHAPSRNAVFDALALKAPLASPAFTGNPTAPTPATSDNDTSIATTAFVQAVVSALIAAAPGTLDTLDELAAAIGDDPNFAATLATSLAGKVDTTRTISTTAPLTGGGNLTANRTIAISAATSGAAGSMSAADKAKLDTHLEGTWTPTVTGVANVSANTPRLGQYVRVGNTVYFCVRVEITPTAAAGTSTSFDITLPVAPANFAQTYDAVGTCTNAEAVYSPGVVISNIGAATARVAFFANTTASRGVLVHGAYKVS